MNYSPFHCYFCDIIIEMGITSIIVLIHYISRSNNSFLGMKCMFKHLNARILVSKGDKYQYFLPIYRFKGDNTKGKWLCSNIP